MTRYSIEPRTRRQRTWTFVIHEKSIKQIWEKVIEHCCKKRLDAAKAAFKKFVLKSPSNRTNDRK